MRAAFFDSGFVITDPLLPPQECESVIERLNGSAEVKAGTRALLALPWIRELSLRLRTNPMLVELLPSDAVCAQCTLFVKSPTQNWLLPVHQDLSIPVASRVSHPEVKGWSEKEGTLFAQPPANVLATLVAVRLHLDLPSAGDGGLRVVPKSHARGRLSDAEALALRGELGDIPCSIPRGAALVMRPLLLHASSKL